MWQIREVDALGEGERDIAWLRARKRVVKEKRGMALMKEALLDIVRW